MDKPNPLGLELEEVMRAIEKVDAARLAVEEGGPKTLFWILLWRDYPSSEAREPIVKLLAAICHLKPQFVAGFLDSWEKCEPTNPEEPDYAAGYEGGRIRLQIDEATKSG